VSEPDSNAARIWQLIGWAYQEALVQRRGTDAKLLEQSLHSSPVMAKSLTKLTASAIIDRLDRQLSPMGSLALRAAEFFLSQAEEASNHWMDAGMISLGFFRILELEFNERLIFPMVKSLDFEALNKELEALEKQLVPIGGELSKKNKQKVDIWKQMIGSLLRAKAKRVGLELGSLEILIQKSSDVTGVDHKLKAIINTSLSLRLSASGLDAFRSGELGKLLAPSERDRFRNPAAHSRYVDLDTAAECKQYLESALEKLIAYCGDGNEGSHTIH
jgi:hypothetical protein